MPSKGREQRSSGGEQVTPPRAFDTTPPPPPSGDYTYTVEIVMRMQETMGGLKEAVSELKDSIKEIKTEQKEQTKKLESISNKIYAAVAIIALIGFLLQLFGSSLNNLISRPTTPPTVQQPAK